MKAKLISTLAVVALTAAATVEVAAQDLTGEWIVESETPRGAQTMTLKLMQDGPSLSGTVAITRRGPGGQGRSVTFEVSDGAVEGNAFSFSYTIDMRGNSVSQSFSGTFEGDAMEGTIGGPRGERPFTGRRRG